MSQKFVSIEVKFPEKASLLLDTGAMPNLLKEKVIDENYKINRDEILLLSGITNQTVKTLGKIKFDLYGCLTEFHIIPNNFPILQDGLLGNEFFKSAKAKIDYHQGCLIINDTVIPFHSNKIQKLNPRSRTIVEMYTINNIEIGYIPKKEYQPGVFYGNALIKNENGKVYLPVINTTEKEIEMQQQFITLEEVDSVSEDPQIEMVSNQIVTPVLHIKTEDRIQQIIKLLNLDHLLDPDEIEEVKELIKNSQDCFHLPQDKLTCTHLVTHKITTTDDVPIHVKQYRFPPVLKDEIDNQVTKLLNDGIIEPSHSPYNTPIWLVPKKSSDGTKKWRLVLDFRKLNEKTVGDCYPIPNIIEILDQLGEAKFFSTFDLASGFHQIPIDPKDAHKTAFSSQHGHFQYSRMAFGLTNAPATFQRLMDNILTGLQGTELFVYLDDIVIYAKSLKEHKLKYNHLIERLREANLKLQPEKCIFLSREVTYLGHVLSDEGIKPDPKKLLAVKEFPTPQNVKNIRQFLGLSGYYRRFIDKFAVIAQPLTKLLKKDIEFNWQEPQQKAFDLLKQKLCEEPLLKFPNFNEPFILTTDASGFAIGGILSQGDLGKDQPIAYVSKKLSTTEQKYSTYEKEAFAIVYCIHHFRPYLYGRKFTIVTDHRPLIWIKSARDPTSRLARWRLKIEEYNYTIVYREGRSNTAADALSRNPIFFIEIMEAVDEFNKLFTVPVFTIRKKGSKHFVLRRSKRQSKVPDRYTFEKKTKKQTKNPEVNKHKIVKQVTRPESMDSDDLEEEYEMQDPFTEEQRNDLMDAFFNDKEIPEWLLEKDNLHDESPQCQTNENENQNESRDTEIPDLENEKQDKNSNLEPVVHEINFSDDQSSEDSDMENLSDNESLQGNFIESRDPLLIRKDNYIIFLNTDGTPFDDQSKNFLKKKFVGKFDEHELGEIQIIKKGNYHYIGMYIYDKNNPLAATWYELLKGLHKVNNQVKELNLQSFSIPFISKINLVEWKQIKEKLKGLFHKESVIITICLGIVKIPILAERHDIIKEYHSSPVAGHRGVTKTFYRIRSYYYWENMKIDIQNFIQNCLTCKLKKLVRVKTKTAMAVTDTPNMPFEKLALDIVGPLPITNKENRYILTMQCLLTKYYIAVAIPNATASTVAREFLNNFVCKYGAPKSVLTDQGTNFLSKLMKEIAKSLNIRQFKTTAFHPQANGSIERGHHVIIENLKHYVNSRTDWDDQLDFAIFAYNTSVHEGTKFSPYELVFGKPPLLPTGNDLPNYEQLKTEDDYLKELVTRLHHLHKDARENLITAKKKSKENYDKKIHPLEVLPGTHVFLRKEFKTGKFDDMYTGPHQVIEVLDDKNAKIMIKNKEKVVSIDRLLKSYITDK